MSVDDIVNLKKEAEQQINSASDGQTLESLRVKYLGRQGIISDLFVKIPELPCEDRPAFGRQLNEFKNHLGELIKKRQSQLKKISLNQELLDPTLPGVPQETGHLHPLTRILNQICAVFVRMGFSIVEGPEIESEYNNFTGLNIPLQHPSRDAFDTFYLDTQISADTGRPRLTQIASSGRLLLRSHTSPVQIRVMKSQRPPLAVVVPGKVYRPDAADAAHSFMFHQVEGFLVDKNVRFSDLKGVLDIFVRELFGHDVKLRFRPHFFPFTEPSAEVDVSCVICGLREKKKRCSVCGGKGWLEILGCGMIHPNVFAAVGYARGKYTGFAFGMGVERIAMLKYGINDIRMFFENDMRFLSQF